MLVAMIAVRMMEPPLHQIIDMVAVRDDFVAAVRAVLMSRALNLGIAMHRVRGSDGDDMLVNMIRMHMVEMAVMKIVKMVVMANSLVPAGRAMLMGMVGMTLLDAIGHEIHSFAILAPGDS